jgi:protein TonB
MKKTLITFSMLAAFTVAKAQTTDTLKGLRADTLVFTSVQQEPQFPGGMNKFYYYLSGVIRYPGASAQKHIQGKVLLNFIVEKDGSLTHIKVIKSVAKDIDAEAVRVMKGSPKWNPGMQNGNAVRVSYTIPISFTMIGG